MGADVLLGMGPRDVVECWDRICFGGVNPLWKWFECWDQICFGGMNPLWKWFESVDILIQNGFHPFVLLLFSDAGYQEGTKKGVLGASWASLVCPASYPLPQQARQGPGPAPLRTELSAVTPDSPGDSCCGPSLTALT